MILHSPDQKVNVAVRVLIVQDGQILLCQLPGGMMFTPGGRVEFGETLLDTLHREVWEELGRRVTSYRLVYTNENFAPVGGVNFHEYNWFYAVTLDGPVLPVGEEAPHPDDPEGLRLVWRPIASLGGEDVVPPFMQTLFPADWAAGLTEPVKHIVSRSTEAGRTYQVVDLAGGDSPGA